MMLQKNFNRDEVKKLLSRLADQVKVNGSYRGWNNIFGTIPRININTITDGIKLSTNYVTDKFFVPNLLRNGLLSELSQLTLKKSHKITALLMSVPYLPEVLKSYGIDELAINRAIFMLEGNSKIADKIGESIANIIENNKKDNQAELLTRLVDDILDASAQSEKSHITSAKFVHEFLKKFTAHKLPENSAIVEEKEGLLSSKVLSFEQRDIYIKEKEELTKKWGLLDNLSHKFHKYQSLIDSLNTKELLVALTNDTPANMVILKKLNNKYMQFVYNSNNPQQEAENLKEFILAVVSLVSEKEAANSLTPLLNKDIVKKIFSLPNTGAISVYKGLVENLAKDQESFQYLADKILAEKKIFNAAMYDTLEHIYPTTPIESRNTFITYKKMIMSFIELASEKEVGEALKPLATKQLLEDVFALPNAAAILEYKTLVLNLTDNLEEFQELVGEVLIAKKALKPMIGDLLEFVEASEPSLKKQAFEKMLLSIVDLVTQKNVISKLVPLINESLVKDLFAILNKDKASISIEANQKTMGKIILIAKEVLDNKDIQKQIGEDEATMAKSLLTSVPIVKTQVNETQADSSAWKIVVDLVRKLPSKELIEAITNNKKTLAIALDALAKQSNILATVLNKCELTGSKMVEILPSICSPAGLKCIENPSAANITIFLLTDIRVMKFALGTLITFCKNNIKDAIYKAPIVDDLNPKAMQDRVKVIAKDQSAFTDNTQVDLKNMQARVSKVALSDQTTRQEVSAQVDLKDMQAKVDKVVPKDYQMTLKYKKSPSADVQELSAKALNKKNNVNRLMAN